MPIRLSCWWMLETIECQPGLGGLAMRGWCYDTKVVAPRVVMSIDARRRRRHSLTGGVAGGGPWNAEALAGLASTARYFLIHRSGALFVRRL